VFVSIKGRPYTWFREGLRARSLPQVRAAVAELGSITLADALLILELISEREPDIYDRAAARWLGRYLLEHQEAGLKQAEIAVAALEQLPEQSATVEVLDGLTR